MKGLKLLLKALKRHLRKFEFSLAKSTVTWGRSFYLWFPGCKREENFSLPQSKSLGSCQTLNYCSSEGHINYNYTECLVLLPGTSTSFSRAQNFFLVAKLAAAATLIRFPVLNDSFGIQESVFFVSKGSLKSCFEIQTRLYLPKTHRPQSLVRTGWGAGVLNLEMDLINLCCLLVISRVQPGQEKNKEWVTQCLHEASEEQPRHLFSPLVSLNTVEFKVVA